MTRYLLLFSILLCIPLQAAYVIKISIEEQRMYVLEDNRIIRSYPISSSVYGEGQEENSFKTPLGKHNIKTKIGTNVDVRI